MIILVTLIIAVVGLYFGKKLENNSKSDPEDVATLHNVLSYFGAIGAVLSVVFVVALIVQYATLGPRNEAHKEEYTALTYKLESGACVDDFGLMKKEIIDEIQDWNEDISYARAAKDNFWIGVFYPDMYEGLDTFDFQNFNPNNK